MSIKFTNGIEFTFKDLISFGVVISTIVYAVAIMPQQILSAVDAHYALKESVVMVEARLTRIEGKIDRLGEFVMSGGAK
jgi:hypothetical protein